MLALLLMTAGCDLRDSSTELGFKECEIGELEFNDALIRQLEEFSNIDLPPNSQGIKLHYLPPVDPVYFAKIQLPENSVVGFKERMLQMESRPFQASFANERCDWWPSSFGDAFFSWQTIGDAHVELHIVEEGEKVFLYLKAFTI